MDCIQLVTDSTADLPREVHEKHGIEIVPLMVHLGYVGKCNVTPTRRIAS
jgi:fatty acid-binding protein DegV